MNGRRSSRTVSAYRTPSTSPDNHSACAATARKANADMARTSVAGPPPPIAVSVAPPSPPSPPLAHVSSLATFAAEMFVWLWFAPSGAGSEADQAREGAGISSSLAKLQFVPTERFVRFCHEVLTTTQVSHSVVLLALLFISRLKQRNAINGAPGSEFRLAVTGLMLANKVLDDNTYTAQTWSQVSSLELKPLVAGEAEFLKGLDWSLHVTERDFNAWLRLLEGHVAARNARLGKAPRKISSSKRARQAGANDALHGLGIGFDAEKDAKAWWEAPKEEEGDGRRVRRKVGEAVSAASTPIVSFGTFSIPAQAPGSAPHPRVPAPLPHYDPHSASASAATGPASAIDVSPTVIASANRRSSYWQRPAANLNSTSTKRRADDAFAPEPSLPAPIPVRQGYMTRTYSAGPACSSGPSSVRLTPPYVHPSHQLPSPLAGFSPAPPPSSSSRPPPPNLPPSAAQQFHTLVDPFSPRYDPSQPMHQRLSSLGYYSLAAGQGHGHLRQTLPPPMQPTFAYAPHLSYPPHPHAYHPSRPPPPPHAFHSAYSLPSRSIYTHAPHHSSTLSGGTLRTSPPSRLCISTTATPSSSTAMIPSMSSHGLSSTYPESTGFRRVSGIASSPVGLGEVTSTPRPGSEYALPGSWAYGGGYRQRQRMPMSAGLPPPLQQPPPPATQQAQGQQPYSSFSNAGPPGVYWAEGGM
ncbi:hypothetical protein JCM1840_003559 [Sporobolomyces johnsonii]